MYSERAREILHVVRGGSSLPLLIRSESGARYMLKAAGAGEGRSGRIAEWLCSLLARVLDIPVPEPALIDIDARFAATAADPEIRELLERSIGLNFAGHYIANARPYTATARDAVPQILQERIYALDLALLNVDRTNENPNMFLAAGQLWCIDYATPCRLLQTEGINPATELRYLQELRKHPFFRQENSTAEVSAGLAALDSAMLEKMLASLPHYWFSESGFTHAALASSLQSIVASVGELAVLHAKVCALPLESAEERRARQLANRRRFEARFPEGRV